MHGNLAIIVYEATVRIQKRLPLFSLKSIFNFHPEAVFKMQLYDFVCHLSEGSEKQIDAKNNSIVHLIRSLR